MQKKENHMYEKMFFKSGTCKKCKSRGVMLMGTKRDYSYGICCECDSETFNKVGEIQKARWLSGGPANPPRRHYRNAHEAR